MFGRRETIVNYPAIIDYPCRKSTVKLGLYIIPYTKMNCSKLKTKGKNQNLKITPTDQ